MAPLGIITTIVSAIRVNGPIWLKAIIGRSRENMSAAEMELMSSTSQETCELWNGNNVVRCQGLAPVKEFICLLPPGVETANIKRIRFARLDDAVREDLVEKQEADSPALGNIFLNLTSWFQTSWKPALSRPRSRDVESPPPLPLESLEQQSKEQPNPTPEMVILRNTATQAPNITLNRHEKVTRRPLYIAASFGCTLQLGVLIYFGLIANHPDFQLKKDGKTITGYAYPFATAGTIILVTGVFICYRLHVVWLQSKQTVSDQVFKSFALYPRNCPQMITTSQRNGPGNEVTRKHEQQEPRWPINLSVVATAICLTGFFIQFIGLRAMHWSASVSQLVAIILMTIVRALVRRGFTAPINDIELRESFELDGLAIALGNPDPSNESGSPTTGKKFDFGLSKGGSWTVMMDEDETPPQPSDDNTQPSNISSSKTQKPVKDIFPPLEESTVVKTINKGQDILHIRTRLAQLADWRGPTSSEAAQLSETIEVTMNALCSTFKLDVFTWTVAVQVIDSNGLEKALPVVLTLKRRDHQWKCRADEIDSVLSLWLCSIDKRRQLYGRDSSLYASELPLKMDSDEWFRKKGSETGGGLILLGQQTDELRRSIKWWMPTDWSKDLLVEDNRSLSSTSSWRTIGTKRSDFSKRIAAVKPCSPPSPTQDSSFLVVQSHETLQNLYARHIFSSFTWAAALQMDKAIDNHSELESSNVSRIQDWSHLHLSCNGLSKLARAIQDSGLMDLHDAYLALIPPLHSQSRLGELDSIVELMSRKAIQHKRLLNWNAAARCYRQLFDLAKSFRVDSHIYTKTLAIIAEYVRSLTIILDDAQGIGTKDLDEAKEARDDLASLLKNETDPRFMKYLKKLYRYQRRGWGDDIFANVPDEEGEIKMCNFTKLHHRIASLSDNSDHDHPVAGNDNVEETDMMLNAEIREHVNSQDILGWTPLHYAIATDESKSGHWVERLLNEEADVNAADIREWTPLHYSYVYDHDDAIDALLGRGADVQAVGIDGMTPLHCAALTDLYWGPRKMDFYVRQPADEFVTDNFGRAPIHLAALKGNEGLIKHLRRSTGARDKEGRTAVHLAPLSNRLSIIEELAKNGANLDDLTSAASFGTVLHWAAKEGRLEAVKELLRLGATVDSRDYTYRTPLHYACQEGHHEIVQLLILHNADVNATNDLDQTPIMLALLNGYLKIVNLLLDAKDIDLNAGGTSEKDIYNVLDLVVKRGEAELVRRLVEKGAEIDQRTLYYAERSSQQDSSTLEFLRRAYSSQVASKKDTPKDGGDGV
ncbi:hypothetical protein FAUST_6656 [Fusarium austroamericanum]|uniref:Ankyrin repeat protein n=1 Tax=Fusarium austroamericanum TaxID=282268 RepID=A0AAN6BZ77_FUSAU|nr:hypothetical protein FAUST_6656 [Fusarium austroamericanum]